MSSPDPLLISEFDIVLRGYDRTQVADVVDRALYALYALTGDPLHARPPQPKITAEELGRCEFDIVLRGYDRTQVADYLDAVAARITAAESHADS